MINFVPYFNYDYVPYFDDNRIVYLFQDEEKAIEYACNNRISIKREEIMPKTFFRQCYRYGAKTIFTNKEIDLSRQKFSGEYFNPETNAAILKLKEHQLPQYIKAIKRGKFLLPATISRGLFYGSFKFEEQTYIIAFTGLSDFNCWQKNHEEYAPLEVSGQELFDIARKYNLAINPGGCPQLVLTPAQMKF